MKNETVKRVYKTIVLSALCGILLLTAFIFVSSAAEKAQTVAAMPTGTYTGKLASKTASVIYEFAVPARGVLRYAAKADGAKAGEWKLTLYQEYYVNGSGGETALRELNLLEAAAENGKTAAPGIGLMPGKYAVKVTAGSTFSASPFTLELRLHSGAEYEIEYHDYVTRYTEIWPNVPVKGSASLYSNGRDEDWFMLRTYSDCAIDLLFEHTAKDLPTAAYKIYLYDRSLNELYAGVALHSSSAFSGGRVGLPAGVYFILVQSRVYAPGEYTLTPRRVNDTYEKEMNDTVSAATPIYSGQLMNGALSLRSGRTDRDYFTFTTKTAGYVSVYLKNLTAPKESDGNIRRLSLMDSKERTIWSALISDVADKITLPFAGLAAGRYYLLVDNDNLRPSDAPYELGYTFKAANNREREYNGEKANANALAANKPVYGNLTDHGAAFDEDWFTFTCKTAGQIRLGLAHQKSEGKKDIFNVTLYNAAGEQQGRVLVSKENNASVSAVFSVEPGKYYVKVTSGKYNTSMRYTLTYSLEK